MSSDLKISTLLVAILDVFAGILIYMDLDKTLIIIEILAGGSAVVLTILKILHVLVQAYRRYKFKKLRNARRKAQRDNQR